MKSPVCVIFIFYIILRLLLTYYLKGLLEDATPSSYVNEIILWCVSTACQRFKPAVWWHWHIAYFSETDPPLYALVKVSDWEMHFLWPCQLPAQMPTWKHCCRKAHMVWVAFVTVPLTKFSKNVQSKSREGGQNCQYEKLISGSVFMTILP